MFRASLSEVELLRDPLATVAELVDEGVFKLRKEGISLAAADRALVAVVNFKLSVQAFDSYELTEETNVGLNIGNLLSVLRRVKGNERVTLSLKDNKFEVLIENSFSRRFTVPVLDVKEEEVQLEELEKKFTAHAKLRPEVLSSGIEDAELVADSAIFAATPHSFEIVAEGDVSSAKLELKKGDEALISLEVESPVKARYAIDYLERMLRATRIADLVELDWGQDFPMRMRLKAGDKLSLSMVLAPRMLEE